jgi:hypothetical protein
MNKKVFFATIAFIGAVAVLVLLFLWLSFREVTITFTKTNTPAILYRVENAKQSEQVKLTGSTTLRLQNGNYQLVSQNDLYDTSPVSFTVKDKALQIIYDPSFSTAQLDKLLEAEKVSIANTLKTAYGQTLDTFTQSYGRLYKEGQWYATTLVKKVSRSEDPDLYRVILKKEGATWVIAAKPSLSISIKDHPDIPQEIIRAINKEGIS